MTAAIPIPNRVLALLGVAVLGLLALLVARPLLLGESDESTTVAPTPPAHITPATTVPKPKPVAPAVPAIKLLDGLPSAVAGRLRHSRVVVVSVYTGTSSSDRAALAEARAGAKASGAGFVALNVLNEKVARQLQAFAGAMSTPSTLVIRRPGKIVGQFDTLVDGAVVAQAAHNAGARGGK
jgi:hypothetical protein